MKSKFTSLSATPTVSEKRIGVKVNLALIVSVSFLSCLALTGRAQLGNTPVGLSALSSNTAGKYNTAGGFFTLFKNTTGNYSTAVGAFSLYNNTIGFDNTAVGYRSLFFNIKGFHNTAIGRQALAFNNSSQNTAVGQKSLHNNTSGWDNNANGYKALENNTTGHGNTASGSYALRTNTTGNVNTAIGWSADVFAVNLRNATAIGFGAIASASNHVRVGNTFVTSIGGQVSWTTFSDGRYKKDIKEDVQGLAFINSLRPVTYTLQVKALDGYLNKNKSDVTNTKLSDDDGQPDTELDKAISDDLKQDEEAAEKITYTGFVAQEVEQAAKKLNYAFSGVDKPQTPDGLYGIRYDNFIAPLVKSVQELSKINAEKDAKIDDLQKQINELRVLITTNTKKDITLSDADLKQNTPNPFRGKTTISYTLPQKFTNAQIVVYDISGKILKQVNVSGSGKGTLNFGATALSKGSYKYSLLIDGKIVSSKQMISE